MNDSFDSIDAENNQEIEMRILDVFASQKKGDREDNFGFTRQDALKAISELQPLKNEPRISDMLMYEAFDNILAPLNPELDFDEIQEEMTDFDLIMQQKQNDKQKELSDKLMFQILDEQAQSAGFLNVDIHQKFKEDFLSHMRTKEKKLKTRLREYEEEEIRQKELELQDKIEKEKRRGGWKSQRAKRAAKKQKIAPAFGAKQIDLTQEINVKPELFRFFDPDKVPDTIENIEIEEEYEDAIPDEDLMIDENIGFDERDVLGFEDNTFFTQMETIIEREEKSGLSAYDTKGKYCGKFCNI